MLEFQEGFFEQEVRDGFYLDVTMKTLWASELELLNKVAEVCARHDIQWYAAYGTLLGAIRHEGFVPWDDDMDIWVLRKDYNRLMRFLEEELPEGYRVRSPLTEEGYEQFHSCINNGSGISIAKEWMEENHNCPFTVGLDVFPLDYLPRNPKDQQMQKALFTLVGRIAQLSKNINRGDYDEENSSMTKEEAIQEIKEGLRYLKKTYKFSLDMKWIDEEKWDKITSEVWKWANYVSGMYKEKESDYLVEYLDWVRWEWKKYPKEWFVETYSATFENFMVPIPSGYESLLYLIYGDYYHFILKCGMHEYPFYARQLRQLREFVKNIEKRAEEVNLISIDDIVLKDVHEIPEKWSSYTQKADGTKKRIILMANNLQEYVEYGDEALEALESKLQYFEKICQDVLLWWRPNPNMPVVLEKVDSALAERYIGILEKYRSDAWGILDEDDDIECAVEACDAYYGELNAIVQNVQNFPKPVIISQLDMDELAAANNQLIKRLNKTFFAYSDSITIGEFTYFSNNNYNALVKVRTKDQVVVDMVPFLDEDLLTENLHVKCVSKNDKILFLPANSCNVHIFDAKTNQQKSVSIADVKANSSSDYWDYMCFGDDVYLMPLREGQSLYKWNVQVDTVEVMEWWKITDDQVTLKHVKVNDTQFATLVCGTNIVCLTDIEKEEISIINLPSEKVVSFTFDGTNFWYICEAKSEINKWKPTELRAVVYEIPQDDIWASRNRKYLNSISCFEKNLFFVSQNGRTVFAFNLQSEELRTIIQIEERKVEFDSRDYCAFFKKSDDKLVMNYLSVDVEYEIDLNTLQVKECPLEYVLSQQHKDYQNSILIKKNALVYEEINDIEMNLLWNGNIL